VRYGRGTGKTGAKCQGGTEDCFWGTWCYWSGRRSGLTSWGLRVGGWEVPGLAPSFSASLVDLQGVLNGWGLLRPVVFYENAPLLCFVYASTVLLPCLSHTGVMLQPYGYGFTLQEGILRSLYTEGIDTLLIITYQKASRD